MKDTNATSKSKPRSIVFGQPKLSFARDARKARREKYRQLVAGLRRRVTA